jgi:hypothetical protein
MGLEQVLEKGLVKLKERIGACATKRVMGKQGYRILESTNKSTGRLVLRVVK